MERIKSKLDTYVDLWNEFDMVRRGEALPRMRGEPATEQELEKLENKLGLRLSPSHKAALLSCNGITNFDLTMASLMSTNSLAKQEEIRASFEDIMDTSELLVVISGDADFDSIWMNPKVVNDSGEMEVLWVNEYGIDDERWPSFEAFIDFRIEQLIEAVGGEKADRAQLPDD
ncbi:MAG: SMI1/KNR4 family protein [Nannocystaceae bacterium]